MNRNIPLLNQAPFLGRITYPTGHSAAHVKGCSFSELFALHSQHMSAWNMNGTEWDRICRTGPEWNGMERHFEGSVRNGMECNELSSRFKGKIIERDGFRLRF